LGTGPTTGAFKIRSESKSNNLVTLCRHHSINLMFTTQYLTAIPPIIRNNVRLWVVFKFSNSERLLKHVYPEKAILLRKKSFKSYTNTQQIMIMIH
jgi:hypothetical protein